MSEMVCSSVNHGVPNGTLLTIPDRMDGHLGYILRVTYGHKRRGAEETG